MLTHTKRRTRSRWGAVLLTVVTAVALLAPSANAPAQATPKWKTYTQSYNIARDFMSQDIHRCFHIVLSGKIQFQRIKWFQGPDERHSYRNPKLLNPRIEVFTKRSCSRSARLMKSRGADLQQEWYDSGCEYTPSIGVSTWSAGFSVSRSCGRTHNGYRKTSPRNENGQVTYFQANSGTAPVSWKFESGSDYRICVRTIASVTVYTRNGSDTKDISDALVCGSVDLQ